MTLQEKQLYVFGYGLPLVLVVLGLKHWHQHGPGILSILPLSLAALMLLITRYNRRALTAIFKAWMVTATAIGHALTLCLLSAVFILVFVPAGLLLRLLKKDFLPRTINRQAASYWSKRAHVLNAKEDALQQF